MLGYAVDTRVMQLSNVHAAVGPRGSLYVLVGSYGAVLPARLVRHGAYFDFMAVWEDADASKSEWEELVDVLTQEVRASRQLQELLTAGGKGKRSFRMLHRPMILKG